MKAKLIMTVEEAEKDHEAWARLRNQGIGGSDVAVIMGYNPWKKPYALYCEKIGLVEPEDLSDNEAVEWGTKLEPIVAQKFSEVTGKKVKRWGTVCNPDAPWQMANFDRLIVGEDAGLECKTANAFKKDEWEGDNVPDAYYAQCQWYNFLSGCAGWWIACLIGGQHFEYKYIPRNESFIDQMIREVTEFWEGNVQAKIPPAVDGTDSTTEAIKKQYPRQAEGTQIALPSVADTWFKRYDELKVLENTLKQEKQECENQLRVLLGENEVGLYEDRKVSWKYQEGRKSIDSKKLEKEFPNAYNACVKQAKGGRVLRVR